MYIFDKESISIIDKELLQFSNEKAKNLKKEKPGYWDIK